MKSYVLGKIFLKALLILLMSLLVLMHCCASSSPTPDNQILDLDEYDLLLISNCADTYCSVTNRPKPVVYTVSFLRDMINYFRQGNDQRFTTLFELAVRNYPLYTSFSN